MFAIVRVNQDYDYVNGVDWVKGGFATCEEAQAYIDALKTADKETQKRRLEFNKAFLARLKLPEDPEKWKEFLAAFNGCWRGCTQGSFKTQFAIYMGNVKFEGMGYDPPTVTWDGNDLYIVEVKE